MPTTPDLPPTNSDIVGPNLLLNGGLAGVLTNLPINDSMTGNTGTPVNSDPSSPLAVVVIDGTVLSPQAVPVGSGAENGTITLPPMFARAGERARRRFVEFFTAEIRNPNTRAAYGRAVARLDRWCSEHGVRLEQLTTVHVAAYVERLGWEVSKPTVKQHLAAIRMLGDYLVTGQVIPANPAAGVRGPKYVLKKGKTPVLTGEEVRALFDSIGADTLAGLRDRALIGVMAYSFARVGAVLQMAVGDYRHQGRKSFLRLHEKGGKDHEVPAHHTAVELLEAYLGAAGIGKDGNTPLFQSITRTGKLSGRRLGRREALAMVKRRAAAAGLGDRICNHSFRASGITNFLENGGTVEKAQQIAAHESPRTTKLYDRTDDRLTLDEIERVRF
ncbi:MAG: site-specific integrase [Gemmataceae bacterium]|nr:site-specific integrase [Gemmataceae bacterium]